MVELNQAWPISNIQQTLDSQVQKDVIVHSGETAKVADLIKKLQDISLALMGDEDGAKFARIREEYEKFLGNAKQLLPTFAENLIPISLDSCSPKEVNEKVQNQIEYVQVLCNNKQTKETNFLDLNLKNYFSNSNAISEIAKTLFNFIKHVLGNSTGR